MTRIVLSFESRARWWFRTGLLAALIPWTGACYTFARVPVDSPPIGENVRLVVDRSSVVEVQQITPDDDAAPALRGLLERVDGTDLLVRVPIESPSDPLGASRGISQLVRIPSEEVLSLERQSFSAARTGFLIGGAAAIGAFIVLAIIDAGRDSDDIDRPNPDLSVNMLRIPIG